MTDETQGQDVLRVPDSYVLNAVLSGNASATYAIQIQQKADFEWLNRIASSTGTFRVRIQDGATGRDLITFNPQVTGSTLAPNTISNANYFGTAQLPNPLLQPYVFARSSSILVTLTDTSGSSNTIEVVFDGFDLYPAEAPAQGASGALVTPSAQAA